MSKIIAMNPQEDSPEWRRMGRAIRWLSVHYLDQPSLEDAAGVVGLSPQYFQRVFQRYVGVSPKAFVGHLTLSHAKRELAGGASVLGAALEAGLSGPSRLHDLCLKVESMTPGEYAKAGAGVAIDYGVAPCPFGQALVLLTRKGICGLAFADEGKEDEALADMMSRWPRAAYHSNNARAADVLRRVFDPEAKGALPPLYLMGTPFQVKVWEALLAIPSGRFSTYGTIAGQLGGANFSRAVGAAVGRNPISWLIPCHRVLGSNGALTGYHWGMERKRAMLAVEAARLEAQSKNQSESPRTSAML